MNNLTQTENENLIALWELDAPVRFPVTPEDWDRYPLIPQPPHGLVVGQQAFDLIVNHRARRSPSNTVKRLITAFPESFAAASAAFRGHEWRTLHYLDQYPIASLGSPSFDGRQALLDILDRDESLNDIPQIWTGSPDPTACILLDLRAIVSNLDPDLAKAAWTILSFSRSLGMEKQEVLQLPWWSTWWISCFVRSECPGAGSRKPKS
jgi:hypothetical protein